METSDIMKLCDRIRETAYEIHRYHGTGYLEKVYIKKFVKSNSSNGTNMLTSLFPPIFAYLAFYRG
jgi:hypothetical protein